MYIYKYVCVYIYILIDTLCSRDLGQMTGTGAQWKVREEVKSVASRACWKVREEVKNVASRASWSAGNLLTST